MQAISKMPDILDMRPFDTCVTLGSIVHSKYPHCLPTAETVLAMMDRYHVAEALGHEHHARLVHPREHGNQRLLHAVNGWPRLHPVWVIEPPKRPGRDTARALVEDMLTAGVCVARLPMKAIPPFLWLWNDLCAALEEHRVPCFLDFGDVNTTGNLTSQDVNGIRDIALAHPELPLILSHIMGGLGVHPAVVPLIKRVNNLYIDICGILEFWREVAREVGPERVVFATGAPFTDPGILISNVQYAHEVDEEAKKMIYGDNLRRLMVQVR